MSKFLMPTRRGFIKSATTAAIGAAMLPKVSAASLLRGGANPSVTPYSPSQPAPAASFNYNTLALWDDFLSPGTIDVNNTLAAGYKWYTSYQQGTGINVLPASALRLNASVVTITPTHATHGGNITQMGCIPGSPNISLVGTPLTGNGMYMEFRCAYSYLNTTGGFPNVYIFDNQLTLNLANSGLSYPANGLAELDLMESYTPTPNMKVYLGMFHWKNLSTQYRNNNYDSALSYSDGNMHSYGTLWVPQSKNSGTGLIQRYIDGVHIGACDVTYTSGGIGSQAPGGAPVGWMSCMEDAPGGLGFSMQLGSGYNWPVYFDSVQVWQ